MKEILLTQDKVALVDDEDYEWLNQYKWCALKDNYTFYAARYIYEGYKKSGMLQMHRELLGLKKGDGRIGDHKNRNGLDNRRFNIRIASYSINGYNRILTRNTSGFRGVVWNKNKYLWIARITIKNRVIFCGYFKDIIAAARAYDAAAIQYYGEDAALNFKEEHESLVCL